MRRVRMAPEGWPFLLSAVGPALVLAILGWGLLSEGGTLDPLIRGGACFFGLSVAFMAFFFRDPLRTPPPGAGLVLAPADGRILQVSQVEEPTVMGGPATRVTIFLSIFNVHVQRAPVAGVVTHRGYNPGSYLAAWNPRAGAENEQASLGLSSESGPVLVRQIAGLVARRIVTDHDEGDRVRQGDRIGLIRFGSRVDLFLPPGWNLECKEGDRVRGGATVVARIPDPPARPMPDKETL